MVRTVVLRLGRALVTAWLISSAVFLLSRGLAGGTPQRLTDTALGRQQDRSAVETQYRQRLGLTTPLFYCDIMPWRWHGTPNQYHSWLTELLRGRLGYSFRDGLPVEAHLQQALGVTLPLTLSALTLTGLLSMFLAQWAARTPRVLRVVSAGAYLIDALPLFLLGLLLLLLFANPDFWPVFPAYGLGSAPGHTWLTTAHHLVLPVAALTLASIPGVFLPSAAALRQQWTQPYVTTARAKGVPVPRLWRRHITPNALPVFITRCSDLLPGVVTGAVVIEVLFALPGMGRLLADAAAARDLPMLIGGVWLIALIRLLAWLLADVANALADPRYQVA